jgi:hypothetical protein
MSLAKVNWNWRYGPILIYIVLCTMFYAHAKLYPSLSDAKNYVDIALVFRRQGFLSNFEGLRTYLYPAFLYLLSFVQGWRLTSDVAAIVQCGLYAFLTLGISNEISRYSTYIGTAVFLGLILNALAIVLLVDTLTEGPTIILTLAMTWTILRAARETGPKMVAWLITGAAFAAAALMVRPANIALLIAWHCAALFQCLQAGPGLRTRFLVYYGLGALVLTAAITGPQLYYNIRFYNKASILPAADLGSHQVEWGIMMMKYATVVTASGAEPVIYKNPFYSSEDLTSGALRWYFDHPIAGIRTVAAHIFNSFSWDYPFVYIYDLTPSYSLALPFTVWFLQILGAYALVQSIVTFLRKRKFREAIAAPVLFIACATGAIMGLNSLVAVENRFNILPTMLLLVFAANFIQMHLRRGDRTTIIVLAGTVMLASAATFGTIKVKDFADPIIKAKAVLSKQ